jgi:chromosome segregation ATPase
MSIKRLNMIVAVVVFVASGSMVFAQQNNPTTVAPRRVAPSMETQNEAQEIRAEYQQEAQKEREMIREEAQQDRAEIQKEVQQKREEVRMEVQSMIASGTPVSAEVLEQIQQKRAEIQNEIKARQQEIQNELQQKRTEVQASIKTQREALQQQVQKIKDERKQQIILNVGDQFSQLNEKITDTLLKTTERLQTILGNIESRGIQIEAGGVDISKLTSAIDSAKKTIQSAHDAIQAQATKTYPITISQDGANPQLDVVKVRQMLQADLNVIRTTVQSVREKVQEAATVLFQLTPITTPEAISTSTE